MSNFAYGDSCQTGDDKYVIAQFHSDASLGWVHELRSFLNLAELKYKWFEPRRHQVQSKAELWRKVDGGVHQANITIIDPHRYRDEAIISWLEQQAEPGIDFDERTITAQSALWMISDSPLNIGSMFDIDWRFETGLLEGEDFLPSTLALRAGGKLKDAITLAARSHAMLGPSERAQLISHSLGVGLSPLTLGTIREMRRIFDREHSKSIPILNEFYQRLLHAAGRRGIALRPIATDIVSETESQDIDHIQAADMAAGWAVDLLIFTNGDYRTLAQRFASVSVNGIIVPG